MSTNSTLPETDNSAFLDEEEESLASGNGWLAVIVGSVLLLAIIGYMFMPGESGRRVISSVMPSVMLGEASVTGARAEEKPAAATKVPDAPTAEVTKPNAATATRPRARVVVEEGLDSRQVQAITPGSPAAIEETVSATATPAAPATFTLTGRILDENGRPLAGATVLLKGSHKGTGTDANGNYSLEVPTGENSLVYGYGGYQDQDMHTRGTQPVNVTLLPAEGTKRRRK